MPVQIVTDNTTGEKLRISWAEGNPPTENELAQLFDRQKGTDDGMGNGLGQRNTAADGNTSEPPQQDVSQIRLPGDTFAIESPGDKTAFAEDALDVSAELAAGVNRGVTGLVDMVGPELFNNLASLFDSDMRAPTLRENMPGIEGGFMEEGLPREAVRMIGEYGVPMLGATKAVQARNLASPSGAAAEFLGFGSAAPASIVAQGLPAPQPTLARELATKRQEGDLAGAGYALNEDGRVVADPIQQKLMGWGHQVQPGIVAMLKDATPRTRRIMLDMVDEVERGMSNAKYKVMNRPLEKTGESIAERLRYAKSVQREAGKSMDKVAKGLEGQHVDINAPISNLMERLSGYNVGFVPDGKGGIAADFSQSDFVNMPDLQKTVEGMVDKIFSAQRTDARGLHGLKKFIDRQVNYASRQTGMDAELEGMFKGFRGGINEVLREHFPEYKKVNTVYAQSKNILDEIQRIAGRNTDLYGDMAPKALTGKVRGLLSNAQYRTNLLGALGELDSFVKSQGASKKKFGDDIITQVKFVDEMERLFGKVVVAETSLQGDLLKSVGGGAVKRGAIEAGLNFVADKAKASDKQTLDAFRELLRQNVKDQ